MALLDLCKTITKATLPVTDHVLDSTVEINNSPLRYNNEGPRDITFARYDNIASSESILSMPCLDVSNLSGRRKSSGLSLYNNAVVSITTAGIMSPVDSNLHTGKQLKQDDNYTIDATNSNSVPTVPYRVPHIPRLQLAKATEHMTGNNKQSLLAGGTRSSRRRSLLVIQNNLSNRGGKPSNISTANTISKPIPLNSSIMSYYNSHTNSNRSGHTSSSSTPAPKQTPHRSFKDTLHKLAFRLGETFVTNSIWALDAQMQNMNSLSKTKTDGENNYDDSTKDTARPSPSITDTTSATSGASTKPLDDAKSLQSKMLCIELLSKVCSRIMSDKGVALSHEITKHLHLQTLANELWSACYLHDPDSIHIQPHIMNLCSLLVHYTSAANTINKKNMEQLKITQQTLGFLTTSRQRKGSVTNRYVWNTCYGYVLFMLSGLSRNLHDVCLEMMIHKDKIVAWNSPLVRCLVKQRYWSQDMIL